MDNKNKSLHIKSDWKVKINYRPYFSLVLIIGLMSLIVLSGLYKQNSKNIQEGIASELIRFHVIANSDSVKDQDLKLQVRDIVNKELEPLLKNVSSVSEAGAILRANLGHMEELSNRTLASNGFQYKARASLETDYFPRRDYGDISLPPGEYETLRIELGDSGGQNWWCIMYPPLCFVDSTYSVVPESSKEQLRNSLTEEEYSEILIYDDVKQIENDQVIDIQVRFKIFTFLNDIFNLD